MFNMRDGANASGVLKHTRFFYMLMGALFVLSQVFLFIQPAEAATATVSNEPELIAALADGSNDTIDLISDITTSAEISVSRSVTINGNGYAILPTFTGSGANNSTVEIIGVDGVTINDLIIDGIGSIDTHGLNIYKSTNVLLNNLSSSSHDQSGIVVNGSIVTVVDVTTFGNTWNGINVDQGGGVTDPAVLSVEGISIHNDLGHIYIDDTTKGVTVIDTNGQYLAIEPPGPPDNDLVYILDPERFVFTQGQNLKVNICHANEGIKGFTSNKVDIDGLNGHGDHENDIIPPNPDLLDGLNWDRANAYFWENECEFPDDPQEEPCEAGPGWGAYIEEVEQGNKKNGGTIDDNRSELEHAVGAPDVVNGVVDGFFSLGFGGWITVGFDGYVMNVEGDDLSFHEATFGNRFAYGEETIAVEVSQDGVEWYPVGEASNHNTDGADGVTLLDFDSTGLDWIAYVRMTDTSDPGDHTSNGDGYDLDSVDATMIVCEEPKDDEFSIEAQKVVCVAEEFLPNWGSGGPAITSSTAQDWVDESQDNCRLVDWNFQWAPNTSNPGNNVYEAGEPWTIFSGSVELEEEDLGRGDKIWVREVFDDGWVPFTGANENKHVSAELYCGTDVLNYDNFDYIRNPEAGEAYYCVGFNAQLFEPCHEGNQIFMIGDDEATQEDNPADEFSWNGAFGDFSLPTDDPFVLPFSDTDHFPWNSNKNSNRATDFDVEFYYDGSVLSEARLTVAWSPGRSGSENKTIYLDGDIVGSASHHGASVPGWFSNMEVFDDTFSFPLEPGWHTLRMTQTSGDGTLWDFVKLEVVDCGDGEIQGRKYQDVNANGDFDRAEKREDGNPNRLNDWTISLFNESWELVAQMATGDDGTEAGNVQRGQFRFVGLNHGTYFVCEENREGWIQSEPASGEEHEGLYCYSVVIDGETTFVDSVHFGNYEAIGRIQGLVYNDQNNNSLQEAEEPGMNGWDVWLLTKNSLYTIRAIQTTDDSGSGEFLFEDLDFGTYYVCQDLQDGWLQTQLNSAGAGGVDPSTPIVGDMLDLDDAVVAQFCYITELTLEEPVSNENDFGNYQEITTPDEDGNVLGDSTTTNEQKESAGQVLGATGDSAMLMPLLGSFLMITALLAAKTSRIHKQ